MRFSQDHDARLSIFRPDEPRTASATALSTKGKDNEVLGFITFSAEMTGSSLLNFRVSVPALKSDIDVILPPGRLVKPTPERRAKPVHLAFY
ncbi:hypothetical protein [Bradyrhizobium monzae]|uniref:hypothetical protein n=1 Tax=Bradyrhizobium sp. Oc8 TaxID=2876780 RepID=UPI001F2A0524|nr:hypothetical protein [Bradyrhizobium sp. Oc8]